MLRFDWLSRVVGVVVAAFLLLAATAAGGASPARTPEFAPAHGRWSFCRTRKGTPGIILGCSRSRRTGSPRTRTSAISATCCIWETSPTTTPIGNGVMREALDELDGKVPYALVPGNHDYTPGGDAAMGKSGLNRYFPVAKFRAWPTFGGAMKEGEMANSYHLFEAGGTRWIIIALEWAPRNAAVQWANDVLAKYPERTAILLTHAYLYNDNTRYDYAAKGKSQAWTPHSCAKGRQRRRGALAKTGAKAQLRADVQWARARFRRRLPFQQERPRQDDAPDAGELPDAESHRRGLSAHPGVPPRRQDRSGQIVLALLRQLSVGPRQSIQL